jgi:hypothetical protein
MNLTPTLDALHIGAPVTAANLTMFPLSRAASSAASPSYLTLDEALSVGEARVTEVSDAGSVPHLRFENSGRLPVLILDGEELVGAKQNRIVNLTILVPAGATLQIPVTCVEAGRWRHRTATFAAAGRAHYASARAMKLAQVNESLRRDGERCADQSAIWSDISDKAAHLGAFSQTQAADALYEARRSELDRLIDSLEPQSGQVGAVFAINGAIAGLDLFDAAATWRKSMRKLVQSYGLEALVLADGWRRDEPPDLPGFLHAIAAATAQEFAAIGSGFDVRFDGPGVNGGALVADGTVIHLVAFPTQHARPRDSWDADGAEREV